MCLEGAEDYMSDVLARLSAETCNMRFGWVNSTVTRGACKDLGYTHQVPEACFPESVIFIDDKIEHVSKMASMDMDFVKMGKEYKLANPEWPFPSL